MQDTLSFVTGGRQSFSDQAAPAVQPQAAPQASPQPPSAPPAAVAKPVFSSDLDAVVRTAYGEDAQNPDAIAAVIYNRGKQSGRGYRNIVTEPGQFEAWSRPDAAKRMMALTPDSPDYKRIAAAVAPVLAGKVDPTNGADSFYSPDLQASLGRSTPKWDDGSGVRIGTQLYFKNVYGTGDGSTPEGDTLSLVTGGKQKFDMTAGLKDRAPNEFIDTNSRQPLNAKQTETFQKLMAAGLISNKAGAPAVAAGTIGPNGIPYYQDSPDAPAPKGPGVYYVDWDGVLRQTPGKPVSGLEGNGMGLLHGAAVVAKNINELDPLNHIKWPGQDTSLADKTKRDWAAQEAWYRSRYDQNGYAATGDAVGQTVASAPVVELGGSVISPVVKAVGGPVGKFLVGEAGQGGNLLMHGVRSSPNQLVRLGSLASRGAAEGAGAGALTADSDKPLLPQVVGGAMGGGAFRAGQPLVASVGNKLLGVASTPEQAAVRQFENLLIQSGKTPEQILAGNGLTTAENIGPGAEAMLSALGRRPGTTGDALTATLEGRNQTLARRFENATSNATGIDRDFVSGDTESLARKMQRAAKPLYDQYNELGPLTSPTMEGILQRPSVQKALKLALTNAKEEGYSPEDQQILQQLVDGLPTDAGPRGNANDYVQQAQEYLASQGASKALKRALGPSLIDYLSSKGGLHDAGGDLAAMDAHIAHKGTPFMRKLVTPNGKGLDDAAVSAWEAGYFPGMKEPPEPGQLLDAIRGELAGRKVYAKPATEAQALAGRVNDFETKLARYGVDPTGKTAKQIAQELADEEAITQSYQDLHDAGTASRAPDSVQVQAGVPNARTLNVVKKVLDNQYVARMDRADTGRLTEDDAALLHGKNQTYAQFRDELKRLVDSTGFDFNGLMQAGGEAPRIRQAFRDGSALVRGNDFDGLKTATKDMSDAEKRTSLGGFINDVTARVAKNQNIGAKELKLYASDDFAKRIALLSGNPDAAQKWQQAMQGLVQERRGLRMMPRTNSITGEVNQANADLDASGLGNGVDVRTLGKALVSPKKTLGDIVANSAQGVADYFGTPQRAAARDYLGNMLMSPNAAKEGLLGSKNVEIRNKLIDYLLTQNPTADEAARLRSSIKKPVLPLNNPFFRPTVGVAGGVAGGNAVNLLMGGGNGG